MFWDQTRTRHIQPVLSHSFFFPSFISLPNTKVFEDDVQDLLRSDPTSDPTQAGQRQPDALGCQGQVHVTIGLVLSQGRHTLLQMGPVTGLGQCGGARQRVATPTEEARAQNRPERSLLVFRSGSLSQRQVTSKNKLKTAFFFVRKTKSPLKINAPSVNKLVLSTWTPLNDKLTESWRCCAVWPESPAVLGWCDRRGGKQEGVQTLLSAPRPAAAAAPPAAGLFYSAPAEPCLKKKRGVSSHKSPSGKQSFHQQHIFYVFIFIIN